MLYDFSAMIQPLDAPLDLLREQPKLLKVGIEDLDLCGFLRIDSVSWCDHSGRVQSAYFRAWQGCVQQV